MILASLIASGFGSGRLRPAPGTWGSLAALAAWVGLSRLLVRLPVPLAETLFLALPLLLTWIGIRASTAAVRATGEKDPSWIVIDEWAGQWIALWPLRWEAPDLRLIAPFLLFRLFDIWKPWPCHALQDLPEGEGIVADDVVAGLYALPLVSLFTHGSLAFTTFHRF